MPGVNWLLNLQARFESLAGANRAVERLTQSATTGERAVEHYASASGNALDKYAAASGASAARMAQSVSNSADVINAATQHAQSAIDRMNAEKFESISNTASRAETSISAATQELVDRLGPLQDAIANAFTPAQRTAAVENLTKAMQRFGLVATSSANEATVATDITRDSLQFLANTGVIAANHIAEVDHAMRTEAQAAKIAAAESKSKAAAQREAEAAARRMTTAQARLERDLARSNREIERNRQATERAKNQYDALGLSLSNAEAAVESATAAMDAAGNAVAGNAKASEDLARATTAAAQAQTYAEQAAQALASGDLAGAQAALKNANSQSRLAQSAARSAQRIADNAARQEQAARSAEHHASAIMRLGGAFTQMQNPLDGVTKKLTRMALSFFTVRKLVRYLINAVSRAPDQIGNSLTKLKSTISDAFARVTVSALAGLQKSLDRLKAALDSPGGQRFLRGLEVAARLAGQALGYVVDMVAVAVEWIGNHFQQAATVAAVALAFFGAKALFAAAATLAANWPVMLLIGLMAALVVGLTSAGVTAEQIFNGIGQAAGWLYATVYNLVADAWNLFASFAEFFANVWNDPLSAVAHLFVDVFDSIVGVVETAAKAIDALLGSNMASAVSGFRGKLQSWVDTKFGAKGIKIERMEKLDNAATMKSWGSKAESIATGFSGVALDLQTPQAIKGINGIKSDTGAIRKSVSMAEEDLKSLVDMAERRFVAQFNLQHLAPQITVNGANTGNTVADAEAIAEAIKQMLIEQTASGSYIATALP